MTIGIFAVNIIVVIDEVFVTRIVRRIDVDDIYLPLMRITEGRKRLKVVTLNQNMIRSIKIVAQYSFILHFAKHGQVVAQTIFNVLFVVFPNETIRFLLVKQFQQSRLLIIRQPC